MRLAMASPSPVAPGGLEVCRKRLPTPPVARTIAGAKKAFTRPAAGSQR